MRRKPNARHALDGTYRADRHGIGASFPRTGKLVPPEWLSATGKEKYQLLVQQLDAIPGLLADVDMDQLALYADAFAEFVDACALIQRDGMVCVSEKGGRYVHPAINIKSAAAKRMQQIGACFGMSPTTRDKIGMAETADKETQEFFKLLRVRANGSSA